jgi:hypothetical protein
VQRVSYLWCIVASRTIASLVAGYRLWFYVWVSWSLSLRRSSVAKLLSFDLD